MGYNSHSIFITKHKFAIKIEKKLSNVEFRYHLGVKFLEMKGISKIFICLDFPILIANLCLVMKIEWELYPICQFLVPVLKIFQIRRVCAKKIDNNPSNFWVSKVAIYGAYDQYKLCF